MAVSAISEAIDESLQGPICRLLSFGQFRKLGIGFDEHAHSLLQELRYGVHAPIQSLLDGARAGFGLCLTSQNKLNGALNVHGARIPRRSPHWPLAAPRELALRLLKIVAVRFPHALAREGR